MNKSGCLWIIAITVSIIGFQNPTIFTWIGLAIIVYLIMKYTFRANRIDRLKKYIRENDYWNFRKLLQKSYGSLTKRQIEKVQLYYVQTIKENGLHSICCDEIIGKNKPCYYYYPVQLVRMRQSGGAKYIDFKNAETATLYLFRTTLEIVSSGHRVIGLANIIDTEVKDAENKQVLSIIIRNAGSPALIMCPDAIIVKKLIEILQ